MFRSTDDGTPIADLGRDEKESHLFKGAADPNKAAARSP